MILAPPSGGRAPASLPLSWQGRRRPLQRQIPVFSNCAIVRTWGAEVLRPYAKWGGSRSGWFDFAL